MAGIVEALSPRFLVLYALGFLFSVQIAGPGYFNAEFLTERGVSDAGISLVYVLGSFVGITLFILLPRLLNRLGNRRMATAVSVLMAMNALLLASTHGEVAPGAYLALFLGGQMVMYTLIDIFIEARIGTNEGITGRVRGIYLTAANAGFVVAPFIAGHLITQVSFEYLYLSVAALGIATSVFVIRTFKHFKDPVYERHGIHDAIRCIATSPMIQRALSVQFLLRFFYALELIYMSVYFHEHLGIPLDVLGAVYAVSLLPFVLVQFPLGFLGDTRFGEREMLALGFALAGASTAALAFLPSGAPVLLTVVMFAMNIGAATVEIMSEAYFFKHMKGRNDGEIVAFRMLTPLAYILAPLTGLAIVAVSPMGNVFAYLGVILMVGVPLSLSLKDTR